MAPIDLARLRDFSDGTDQGMRELAGLFLSHMEECVEALRSGMQAGDSERLRTEAHRAAGTAGACGANALAALLSGLETTDAAERVAASLTRVPEIEAELSQVRQFLSGSLGHVGDHSAPDAKAPQ